MPHTQFMSRCFQLPRNQIAYVRFILESYDGLAFLRTLEPGRALVEIGYPKLRQKDAEELIQALGEELDLLETSRPENYRPL